MNPPPKNRLSLRDSLHRYWPNLIGIAIFPGVWNLGLRYGLPSLIFGVGFVAVAVHALWPYARRDAPAGFWFVAMALFFVGGLLGGPVADAMVDFVYEHG